MLQTYLKIWIESEELRSEIWEKKYEDLKTFEVLWCEFSFQKGYTFSFKKRNFSFHIGP